MHLLYEVSVWLHIVAATIWVGGMLFLVMVVVPWLREEGRNAAVFLRETGGRFRNVGWACFAIFLITGIFNLWMRGVRLANLFQADWLATDFGRVVMLKIGLFALIVAISAAHDFVVGPRATTAIEQDPRSEATRSLRRRASVLGRMNVVLALVAVFLGVMLVRGVPG